jgi:hypothetical protein
MLCRTRTLSLSNAVRKIVQNFQLDFFSFLSWVDVSAVHFHFVTTGTVVSNNRFLVQLLGNFFRHPSNWRRALTVVCYVILILHTRVAVSDSFRYRALSCSDKVLPEIAYLCCRSFMEIFLPSNHI